MQPNPEDRLDSSRPRRGLPVLSIAIVIALLGAAVWYFTAGDTPAPASPAPVITAPVPAQPALPPQPPAPDIPAPSALAPDPEAAAPTEPEEPALTLEQSDPVLRARLDMAGESNLLADALDEDNLVERGATLVDVFSRGLLLHRVLPVPPPQEKFMAEEEGGQLVIAAQTYARYDAYAAAVDELEVETLVSSFHLARPLLEEAYARLGYAPEEFDNALIRALDRILATPVVENSPVVEPVEGVYRFADPALEQLAPLQKLLLRMGPENAATVREKAAALRRALLQQ